MADDRVKATLLSAVTTTGTGTALDTPKVNNLTAVITHTAITTGGTVLIEASNDGTNWATASTTACTANGSTLVKHVDLAVLKIRPNVSARTDGTYTVTVFGNG